MTSQYLMAVKTLTKIFIKFFGKDFFFPFNVFPFPFPQSLHSTSLPRQRFISPLSFAYGILFSFFLLPKSLPAFFCGILYHKDETPSTQVTRRSKIADTSSCLEYLPSSPISFFPSLLFPFLNFHNYREHLHDPTFLPL